MNNKNTPLSRRFRGLLPIVIDVETSGLNPATDALLELAAISLMVNAEGKLIKNQMLAFQIEPFQTARLDQNALQITGIKPFHPLRYAIPEEQALERLFAFVREELAATGCYRAVLVGHNAWFDLSFLLAAVARTGIKNSPFHTFTTLDTAALSAVALGETVLARATRRANISFDINEAHSAIYDAEKTAELFCHIANLRW